MQGDTYLFERFPEAFLRPWMNIERIRILQQKFLLIFFQFGNEFAISFAIFSKLTIGKALADAKCKIHHFWTKIKVRGTFRFENHGNQNVFVFLNLISLGLLKPIIYLFYTTRSLLFVDAFELLLTL